MSIWNNQATRWEHVGFPTRPSLEDGAIITSIAKKKRYGNNSTHIAVLGVTPEIIQLDWPKGSTIDAVDMNPWMIEKLYKPHHTFPTTVHQGYWQSMPMSNASVDLVVGDGIFTPLETVDDYHALFCEMNRILKPAGVMIIRAFIRPDKREKIENIVSDTLAGKIQYFGSLKWRIAMALVDDSFSIKPAEIHRVFESHFSDRNNLSTLCNWSMETISTIDSYRDMESVFTFPTLDELTQLSQKYAKITDIQSGTYELADRCLTIVFEF